MNPVQPEELSALLDGELEPARALEVRAQIAIDPALRLEFETLSAADAAWRIAAGSAAFRPDVEMPAHVEREAGTGDAGWLTALAATIGILIVVRIVLKLAGSEAWALGLPAISLILLLVCVVKFAGSMQEAALRG